VQRRVARGAIPGNSRVRNLQNLGNTPGARRTQSRGSACVRIKARPNQALILLSTRTSMAPRRTARLPPEKSSISCARGQTYDKQKIAQ